MPYDRTKCNKVGGRKARFALVPFRRGFITEVKKCPQPYPNDEADDDDDSGPEPAPGPGANNTTPGGNDTGPGANNTTDNDTGPGANDTGPGANITSCVKAKPMDIEIWKFTNMLRKSPKLFVPYLKDMKSRFTDNMYITATGMRMMTNEGPAAVQELIDYLEGHSEQLGALKWKPELA